MTQVATLQKLISLDPLRCRALEAVAALDLPDCWIGAGFVRDAVWDELHHYEMAEPGGDVDVLWYDSASPNADLDLRIEQKLRTAMPALLWSVKNQARMHHRNGDAPYMSVADAMRYWPETATAVAVRLGRSGSIEVNAPFGLEDLFSLRLRPTPAFRTAKLPVYVGRVTSKRWLQRYPKLAF